MLELILTKVSCDSFIKHYCNKYYYTVFNPKISYGQSEKIIDLVESAYLTKNPDIDLGRLEGTRPKHASPQVYVFSYRYYQNEINPNTVTKYALDAYLKRKDNQEFIKVLHQFQNIYFDIISKYQRGCYSNSEGIYVGNYIVTMDTHHKPVLEYKSEKDMNPMAFTAVKYFMELQSLPYNRSIPKHIYEFIEQHEAVKLLES